MVGDDAVELLGHRAVERAHARLDVRDRDARLGGGQRAGERRVRVAVDEHRVGPLVAQQRAERAEHARRLLGVRAAAERRARSPAAGLRAPDEDRDELVVVVLAGVDEQLVVRGAQRAGDGRGLDELRPVADDRDDLHRVPRQPAACESAASMCSRTAAAAAERQRAGRLRQRARRRSSGPAAPRAATRRGRPRSTVGEVVARRDPLARVGDRQQRAAGDRVEDAVAQRRRVQRAVEDVEERRSSGPRARARAGVTSSASSAPCSRARRVASMFARVGERLDAVEHARRRVRDRLQRDRLGERGQRLERSRSAARRG